MIYLLPTSIHFGDLNQRMEEDMNEVVKVGGEAVARAYIIIMTEKVIVGIFHERR